MNNEETMEKISNIDGAKPKGTKHWETNEMSQKKQWKTLWFNEEWVKICN